MAKKARRGQRRNQLVGVAIGVIIVVTTLISLLAPGRGRSTSSSDTSVSATSTPTPTEVVIPTPEPDPQVEGAIPYLHSTGYFQTFYPIGGDWQNYELAEYNVPPYAGVIMQSQDRLSIVYTYLEAGVEYESLADLSENYWTETELATNWTNYDGWTLTRRVEVDDHLILDFDLMLGGNAYLGRTTSWVADNFLYVIRIVVPANNSILLERLYEKTTPALIGYTSLQTLPQTWPVYVDAVYGFALKHPADWEQVAGEAGRPATFRMPDGQVRVQSEADQAVASADEAEAWITANETGVTILQSDVLAHDRGVGYQVAYTYQDTAGDLHSGLVVLLNGDDSTLHIANLQLNAPDINLLAIDETTSAANYEAVRVLTAGFIVLPGALVTG
ncbi:MAG: hypothetical protein JXA10_10815 [Anaerolineae bacterium]|nr:hypothetical protein [Anaerolineae bacterium]